jgi:predicted metal-dependent hydrolase
MSERLSISALDIDVRRSERRQTIGLTVERDGSVTATVPQALSLAEVERQLRARELWLHSALARRASLAPVVPTKQYVSGEGFLYLGRAYRLRVLGAAAGDQQPPDLRLFQARFHLRGDCASCGRECFVRWYSDRAQTWLAERLPLLQRRVGVEAKRLAVMDLGYRWASCSEYGRLNFHWRAILLPPELVEYLVLHELCHLIEHNHTPRFWSLVSRADRDCEQKERWLRENGGRFEL